MQRRYPSITQLFAIALSSLNPPTVKAIIVLAGSRGGRVDNEPNNNCAPDKLVETTGEFGRTARGPARPPR